VKGHLFSYWATPEEMAESPAKKVLAGVLLWVAAVAALVFLLWLGG
jgi:hypothetical protein